MKSKVISMLLVVSLMLTILAGCGGSPAEEGSKDTPAASGDGGTSDDGSNDGNETEPVDFDDIREISVSFWPLASVPEEIALVEAALNEITEAEIGVTVKLNIMDSGSYITNGAMTNGVINGEDFDVILTAPALSGHFSNMSANGMLQPITDLLKEYAPDLMEIIPDNIFEATTKDGEIYAVPAYSNYVNNMYWVCRTSVLEAANIDINDIETIQDIGEALYKIKEATDMIPMGGNRMSVNVTYPSYSLTAGHKINDFDVLGESTAVAVGAYYDDYTNVVSRYETEEFLADVEILKEWYDNNLLDKDIATDNATSNTLEEKPNVASTMYAGAFDAVARLVPSDDVQYAKIASGSVTTGKVIQFTWAIPVSCDEPEAAAKFLNMLYTDERVVNLLNYGVEGEHYEWKADGTIGFPEGVTSENSGYWMGGTSALLGNYFLAYPWEGTDPNTAEIGKEEMANAVYSPLLGFSLDTSKVPEIYAQLSTIANVEYIPALACGSAPDGFYEEFIDKMYAAGLQEYMDEANRQVQEWLDAR